LIKNKVKKGMILIYTDEYGNQKAISPDELLVITGTVITNELTKEKKVGTGTPKKLGVLLSEQQNEIDNLNKEMNELRTNNRKHIKTIVSMLEILINQAELQNLDINEIKKMQEELNNEE